MIKNMKLDITTTKNEKLELELTDWQVEAVKVILGLGLEDKDGFYVLSQFVDEKVKETTFNLDANFNSESPIIERKTVSVL